MATVSLVSCCVVAAAIALPAAIESAAVLPWRSGGPGSQARRALGICAGVP
jgi:hypothetical protein